VTPALGLTEPGERGEILITGPQVSPGYFEAAELTARAFLDWRGGWAYRTGDLGREEAGFLFFDGRRDDQIKLNGHRIELGDIEANLVALPGVLAAAVVVVRRAGGSDSLTGFAVLDGSETRSGDPGPALKQALAARLPSYMVPRRVRVLERLPMTPNGKVDRKALVELHP
jgi:acyl-coenzyme A synthetase/AMP-(fatty) acid ligase